MRQGSLPIQGRCAMRQGSLPIQVRCAMRQDSLPIQVRCAVRQDCFQSKLKARCAMQAPKAPRIVGTARALPTPVADRPAPRHQFPPPFRWHRDALANASGASRTCRACPPAHSAPAALPHGQPPRTRVATKPPSESSVTVTVTVRAYTRICPSPSITTGKFSYSYSYGYSYR